MKKKSLASQIKRKIGVRIFILFLMVTSLIVMQSVENFNESVNHIKQNILIKSQDLEGTVIGQTLVNNPLPIKISLAAINDSSDAMHFSWMQGPLGSDRSKIVWNFPFSWHYNYPLREINNNYFGYFHINGSFLEQKELVQELIKDIASLIMLIISIGLILYPLIKKIPNQLFIEPINDLISMLKKDNKFSSKKYFSDEIQTIEIKIRELFERVELNTKEAALAKIASQVAHDIRSPLAALDSILSDLSQLPEEKRIITRNAIGRIRDIANNLLLQNRNEKEIPAEVRLSLLTSIIDTLVSEKRLQFRSELNIHIEFTPTVHSYGLFASVDVTEFKRVLSNLINNAVEALHHSGEVLIELTKRDIQAIITIKDNGPGMPVSVIERLGEVGNTLGKEGGSGLGLAHAVQSMKAWGGSMKVDAEPQQGTIIELALPLAKPAPWFLTELVIEPNSRVLILDDDTTIHQIWDERFAQMKEQGIELFHFSHKTSLAEWLSNNDITDKPSKILCDYEIIGYKETGLDIIESLGLAPYSILVTSRYEQPEIQVRCEALNICLLPKSLALLVPININAKVDTLKQLYDLVLLDDDDLIRSTWQMCAVSRKQKIATLESSADLLVLLPTLPMNTPIYLDYSLGEEQTGAEIAKILYEKGYHELYLATGYDGQLDFIKPEWVKAVVGKGYPG